MLTEIVDTGESAPTDVTVKIEVNYTAPSTFDREPPHYRAGVPFSLNCTSSIDGRGFYHWTSDCSTNNCFVKDELKQYVSTDFLRSTDSGIHTCTVEGSKEESGSASITVHVVGKMELVNYEVATSTGSCLWHIIVAKLTIGVHECMVKCTPTNPSLATWLMTPFHPLIWSPTPILQLAIYFANKIRDIKINIIILNISYQILLWSL